MKSSSAPAAYSPFESTDNAISCCVTGGRLLAWDAVTKEQEVERCPNSSSVAQSAGDSGKDRTGFLTAGIREKGWGKG